MSEIVLFHHALGLTDGVRAFADRIRESGTLVDTPDLFGGRTFGTVDEGVAHAREVGLETLVDRGVAAVDGYPEATVFAGISLGALPAVKLAQTHPNARACIVISALPPTDHFEPTWRDGVGLQVHLKDADPWVLDEDLPRARRLDEAGRADVYFYPGSEHLYMEQGHPDFSEQDTAVTVGRLVSFLRRG
jgi:dienelactone hydrolase